MSDLVRQDWPVCPYCGHAHKDAWEWDLGPGLEGDGEFECVDCDKPFRVSRICDVSYTTKATDGTHELSYDWDVIYWEKTS
jgi:hypothetical protein